MIIGWRTHLCCSQSTYVSTAGATYDFLRSTFPTFSSLLTIYAGRAGFDGTVAPNVAHMLAVLVCGTKTDVMGMSRLYVIHDHVPGGDAERGVCS
jgi:hypothetical protein